jgi:predicted nucleic acid-binding protein
VDALPGQGVEVVRQSTRLFEAAFSLYKERMDKSYSMVDCISMVVCKTQRITDVLTADHDFEQEGFTILL